MTDKKCIECGKTATEEHHVIPRSLGGTATVPLCGGCHALVHGGYNKRRDDHIALTVEGLRRAKARGVALGNRTNLAEAQALSRQASIEDANDFALSMYEIVAPLCAAGMTRVQIADYLNEKGIKTKRSGKWHTSSVNNILKRVKKLKAAESGLTPTVQSTSLHEHS